MASENSQLDRPSGDGLELPPVVIAQAEAAAGNASDEGKPANLDSITNENNLKASDTLSDQKYVQCLACYPNIGFSQSLLTVPQKPKKQQNHQIPTLKCRLNNLRRLYTATSMGRLILNRTALNQKPKLPVKWSHQLSWHELM